MAAADVGEVRISFSDVGSGDPVLLLHGWLGDSDDWLFQVPELVSRGYRVISPDLRGHGSSTVPSGGYDEGTCAADALAVLEHLGIDEALVVGHSFGASTAATLGSLSPQRSRGLVLIDGAYGRTREHAEAIASQFLPALRSDHSAEVIAGFVTRLHGAEPQQALLDWHLRRAARVPVSVSEQLAGGMSTRADSVFVRHNAQSLLGSLDLPILVVRAGLQPDEVTWEQECLRDDRSSLHTWPEAGHWLHQEQPERLNSLLCSWLDSILNQ